MRALEEPGIALRRLGAQVIGDMKR